MKNEGDLQVTRISLTQKMGSTDLFFFFDFFEAENPDGKELVNINNRESL